MSFYGPTLIFVAFAVAISMSQTNSSCICVPFYLCENETLNIGGEGLIDIRMKPEQSCSHYLEVCCQEKDVVGLNLNPSPANQDCGYRNPNGIGFRITGDKDNEAQFGEFPWMVAVFNGSGSNQKHFYRCGGSLIHPQVVLTAAHCIDGRRQHFKIRAGEWDSQTQNEMFPHQNVEVASVVIHPHYRKVNLVNDIGLLFLKEPFTLSGHINRVCLPPQGRVASGSGCFVSGWGKTNYESPIAYQTILKKIELPVISRDDCQNAFRKTRLGRKFKLHSTFMCAGGEEGVDSCTGDGGGPLVCPIWGQENRFQQVGIVAWGIGCGLKGIPGAYVDVSYFSNWIDHQLKIRNLDSNSYRF